MNKEDKKINLWNFREFEEYFINEENVLKLAFYCSMLLENWPYRNNNDQRWNKIYKKTEKILRKYYKLYFENDFQTKPFVLEDKIVICTFLDLLQNAFSSVCMGPRLKDGNLLFCFALSFDKVVMYKAFRVLGEKYYYKITKPCLKKIEILLKYANFYINLNDFFPEVRNKTCHIVPHLNIKGNIYEVFKECGNKKNVGDFYIAITDKFYGNDVKFMSILRKNAAIVLLKICKNHDRKLKFHDIEGIIKDIEILRYDSAKINLDNNVEIFMDEIRGTQLFYKLEEIFNWANNESLGFSEISKNGFQNFLGNYLNYVTTKDVEFVVTLERYLLMRFELKIECVPLVKLLKLDEHDGLMYFLIDESLKNPSRKDVHVFKLFKQILDSEIQKDAIGNIIIEKIEHYIQLDKNKVLRAFLESCYTYLFESEKYENIYVTDERIDILCEEIEKYNDGTDYDNIVVCMKILFLIYIKQKLISLNHLKKVTFVLYV